MDYLNNIVDPIKAAKEGIEIIKRINRANLINCRKGITSDIVPKRLDFWTAIKNVLVCSWCVTSTAGTEPKYITISLKFMVFI